VQLDQFLQRDRHFLLDCAGGVDVARDVEQLCSGIALTAKGEKPGSSTAADAL